ESAESDSGRPTTMTDRDDKIEFLVNEHDFIHHINPDTGPPPDNGGVSLSMEPVEQDEWKSWLERQYALFHNAFQNKETHWTWKRFRHWLLRLSEDPKTWIERYDRQFNKTLSE
ncbi:MAG: hypothetical protein ABEK50_11165, partial [bacterium]